MGKKRRGKCHTIRYLNRPRTDEMGKKREAWYDRYRSRAHGLQNNADSRFSPVQEWSQTHAILLLEAVCVIMHNFEDELLALYMEDLCVLGATHNKKLTAAVFCRRNNVAGVSHHGAVDIQYMLRFGRRACQPDKRRVQHLGPPLVGSAQQQPMS